MYKAKCRCEECGYDFEADMVEEEDVGLIFADHEPGCPKGCKGDFKILVSWVSSNQKEEQVSIEEKPIMCEVCNEKESVGVCKALGPMSCAFCRECLIAGRYPWANAVGYAMGLTKETVAPGFMLTLHPTLVFFHKTEEEFWAAVAEADKEYLAYLKKQEYEEAGGAGE